LKTLLRLLLTSVLVASAAQAQELRAPAGMPRMKVAFAQTTGETSIPIGWVGFCKEYPKECAVPTLPTVEFRLTPLVWRALVAINQKVNRAIRPITDEEHWGVAERWSYPDDGKGDCEDYVLLKRRMLMAAGVPRQVLLITVVRDNRGEGHAVLTVATDKGDLILDNKRSQILPWTETGYAFLKRQSREHPNRWEGIGGATATATASR
jgi:predicted transglutaminase-like cysteine proteinase